MKKISLNKKVIANIAKADLNQIKGGDIIIQRTDAICTNGCPANTSACSTVHGCHL